jgi:hypothetical protein
MAKKSRLKRFLIVVLVGVIAGALAVTLYILTPKAAPAPPKSEVSLTLTPDFNACKVISADAIKNTSHADLLTGISDGLRAGMHAPNGTIADTCGYTLVTKKAKNNTLAVEVYQYTATVNGDDKETADASWAQVANSNPTAYFGKDLDGDSIVYKLRVIPGGKNVMFELRQPSNAVTIDEPSALDFLTGIAAKANFEVINPVVNN